MTSGTAAEERGKLLLLLLPPREEEEEATLPPAMVLPASSLLNRPLTDSPRAPAAAAAAGVESGTSTGLSDCRDSIGGSVPSPPCRSSEAWRKGCRVSDACRVIEAIRVMEEEVFRMLRC